MNNKKSIKGYATVLDDDGINYREIADIMSEIGFVMNHSSARNYILRVMTKFAEAFDREWGLDMTDVKFRNVSASPQFQNVISELLHTLEVTE
jgi:transposase-like protein